MRNKSLIEDIQIALDDEDYIDEIYKYIELLSEDFRVNSDLLIRFIRTYIKVRTRTNQWDENTITGNLIDDIINHFHQLKSSDFKMNVFKLNGECEKKFGDIAFIVRTRMKNGKILKGAAFIEAKKEYEESGAYDSFDINQIKRFIENTTHSFYCFYSHNNFFPILESKYLFHKINNSLIAPNKQTNETLFTTISPFSLIDQIERFINSYDLDYSRDTMNIALGFEIKKGCPKHIIIFEQEGTVFPDPSPEHINTEKYSPYDSKQTVEENNLWEQFSNENDDENDDDNIQYLHH